MKQHRTHMARKWGEQRYTRHWSKSRQLKPNTKRLLKPPPALVDEVETARDIVRRRALGLTGKKKGREWGEWVLSGFQWVWVARWWDNWRAIEYCAWCARQVV